MASTFFYITPDYGLRFLGYEDTEALRNADKTFFTK